MIGKGKPCVNSTQKKQSNNNKTYKANLPGLAKGSTHQKDIAKSKLGYDHQKNHFALWIPNFRERSAPF